jgi:esterase/lipase superfamily enzyme
MLAFGDRGFPVILFPTTKGRYHQNKDFGLIDSVRWFVDEGLVKIYCPDTIDDRSWYDKGIHPADRARNYAWYDKMLAEELAPWAMHETGVGTRRWWHTCLPWAARSILKCLPTAFITMIYSTTTLSTFYPAATSPSFGR